MDVQHIPETIMETLPDGTFQVLCTEDNSVYTELTDREFTSLELITGVSHD